MSKLATEFSVEMDGGPTHVVVADQRDYAKLEVQAFAEGAAMHTKARFLAWSALTRQQVITSTFDRFNEVDCIEVVVTDEEGEQGLDPGRSEPSGATSSPSRKPRASRSSSSSTGTRAT